MGLIASKVRCLVNGHDRRWWGKTLDGYHQLRCERCGGSEYVNERTNDRDEPVREPTVRRSGSGKAAVGGARREKGD
jgi:hypothetical protein